MYHVARFVENGRVLVEVIASNWKINQKQILWPNVNKKKFEKYLKERREPDGSWLQIATTLLKQDIGYEEAENFVNDYILKANTESESESSEVERRKSTLPRKKKDTHSSDGFEGHVPAPEPKKNQENDLAILHNKIDALNCRFDFLEEGVDKILKLLSRSDVQDAAVLEEAYPYLPCDGASDLGEFEKSLATEEGKMTLVKHLRTFGGKKADDFIPRALAFAMTDRFAISFTWEGQGNKNKFEDLQFKKVLMKFTIKVFNTTEDFVKEKIKNWLRNAKARAKKNGYIDSESDEDGEVEIEETQKEKTAKVGVKKQPRNSRPKYQPSMRDYFNSNLKPKHVTKEPPSQNSQTETNDETDNSKKDSETETNKDGTAISDLNDTTIQ